MDEPTRLKENFVTNLKSFSKMTPGRSRTRRSPYQNPPPINLVENELARDLGPVRGPHLGSTSPALSCNLTPGLDLILALISALFLLRFPLHSLPINCSKTSWRLTWSRTKDLDSFWLSAKKLLRLRYQRYIMVNCIRTAITSVNSAKITLRPPGPPEPTGHFLQLLFSVGTLVYAGHSSNVAREVNN